MFESGTNQCPVFLSFRFSISIMFSTCPHGERCRNLTAGIFEIQTCLATSRFHYHRSKTDDNGNAMLQSLLSKNLHFKKWLEDTLVPPLW